MNSLTVTSKFAAATVRAGPDRSALQAQPSQKSATTLAARAMLHVELRSTFNGAPVGAGTFDVAPDGTITLPDDHPYRPCRMARRSGVNDMFGNADPVLGLRWRRYHGRGRCKTFTFNFFLPISLTGPIVCASERSATRSRRPLRPARRSRRSCTPKVLEGKGCRYVGRRKTSDRQERGCGRHVLLRRRSGYPAIRSAYEGNGAFFVDPALRY